MKCRTLVLIVGVTATCLGCSRPVREVVRHVGVEVAHKAVKKATSQGGKETVRQAEEAVKRQLGPPEYLPTILTITLCGSVAIGVVLGGSALFVGCFRRRSRTGRSYKEASEPRKGLIRDRKETCEPGDPGLNGDRDDASELEALLRKAATLERRGELEQAISCFGQVIEKVGNHANADLARERIGSIRERIRTENAGDPEFLAAAQRLRKRYRSP